MSNASAHHTFRNLLQSAGHTTPVISITAALVTVIVILPCAVPVPVGPAGVQEAVMPDAFWAMRAMQHGADAGFVLADDGEITQALELGNRCVRWCP